MRREVGSRGYAGRLERRGESDGGRAFPVGADDLGDTEAVLRVAEEREEPFDAVEAEGNVAAAVELFAYPRKAGKGVSGAGFTRGRARDTLRAGG